MAFRTLNDPLKSLNDSLELTNAKLENSIAKLEGRRQNNLKIALLEARDAADKLSDSLAKDLAGLQKVLKENEIGNAYRSLPAPARPLTSVSNSKNCCRKKPQ